MSATTGSTVTPEEAPVDVIDLLRNIDAENGGPRKRAKRIKGRRGRIEAILEGLKWRWSGGLTLDELQLMWRVVSHPNNARLTCRDQRKLIFSMIPDGQVNIKFIMRLIAWVNVARARGFKPSVILAVYQLLNVYFEKQYLEIEGTTTETMLTRVLSTKTEGFAIPWITRLFRNAVNPGVVNAAQVISLNNLLYTPKIKKTHYNDVLACLGICKEIRPDLFYNQDKITFKIRKIALPNDSLESFEMHEVDGSFNADCHPLAEILFPEFLPDVTWKKENDSSSNSIELIMSHLLEKDNTGITKLVESEELVKEFYDWLDLLIRHRSVLSAPFEGSDDTERYKLVFEACKEIMRLKQEIIPCIWKLIVTSEEVTEEAHCFQELFDMVFPFMKPQIIRKDLVKLKVAFLKRIKEEEEYSVMWGKLRDLFDSWMEDLKNRELSDDAENISTCLVWLVNRMHDFTIKTYAQMCGDHANLESRWLEFVDKVKLFVQQLHNNNDLQSYQAFMQKVEYPITQMVEFVTSPRYHQDLKKFVYEDKESFQGIKEETDNEEGIPYSTFADGCATPLDCKCENMETLKMEVDDSEHPSEEVEEGPQFSVDNIKQEPVD